MTPYTIAGFFALLPFAFILVVDSYIIFELLKRWGARVAWQRSAILVSVCMILGLVWGAVGPSLAVLAIPAIPLFCLPQIRLALFAIPYAHGVEQNPWYVSWRYFGILCMASPVGLMFYYVGMYAVCSALGPNP